jgi:hypothetical protein
MGKEKRYDICEFRGRKYGDNLAECHSGQPTCPHRISFGYGYLCTFRIKGDLTECLCDTLTDKQNKKNEKSGS